MEILCVIFLATYSRTNGNLSDFLSNETVFRYLVANCSRTNGNLTQNASTKNEKGISFVRERTTLSREKFGWIAINIRKSTIQIHRPQQDQPDTTVMQRSIRNKNQIVKNEPTVRNQWFWL